MDKNSRDALGEAVIFAETWFDPIEIGIRDRIRGFIEALVDEELNEALRRARYQRPAGGGTAATVGYRHGRRDRRLLGSFGPVTISVPRARLINAGGTSREWRSDALPRYARMTKPAEALIAGAYLSGTNTRRVRRALVALFKSLPPRRRGARCRRACPGLDPGTSSAEPGEKCRRIGRRGAAVRC
jgi:putative transposase